LDGDLDLFATSERGSNKLYLNDGTGHFRDVTESAGLTSNGGGMCASFSDVNNDGLPDLCVSSWYTGNKIYLNETRNGKVKFRDITSLTDLSKSPPAKSNAVVFGDVNNDGYPDLFIANRNSSNKLYLNNGKGIYKDITDQYFDHKVYLSNGAVFADFDLDGFLDLYVTNVGENVLYRNIKGKYFEDVTGKFGAELSGYCTGCATGDIDGDGDIDLYVANYVNGSSTLFVNKIEKRNSVTFKVHGTRSNRDAIGAKVFLYVKNPKGKKDSLAGFQEISGGSGYGSVSSKDVIFGLAPGLKYLALVKFPASGITIRISEVRAGTIIRVNEEEGLAGQFTTIKKAIIRFFTDREIRGEILKYILIIIILAFYLHVHQKGPSSIRILKWSVTLFLFVLFIVINQIFLFHSSVILFFLSPAVVILGLILLHLASERILLKYLSEKEKLDLREKISRDLHDDLASTLGSISIYSNTLKNFDSPPDSNQHKLSSKIEELARAAMQSISDIIWMTAPKNDSLQRLLTKTTTLMSEVLTDNQVGFHAKTDMPESEIMLPVKLRNDVFLILKEGLHNIIAHSEAKNVTLQSWIKEKVCKIILTDDGHGFSEKELKISGSHGNGLVNMRRRASESSILLTVDSEQDKGTRIELSFRI
ncbi:MAG: FG-GAP-like repeat-containing protein, partial [Bacteroidales bacterium]